MASWINLDAGSTFLSTSLFLLIILIDVDARKNLIVWLIFQSAFLSDRSVSFQLSIRAVFVNVALRHIFVSSTFPTFIHIV